MFSQMIQGQVAQGGYWSFLPLVFVLLFAGQANGQSADVDHTLQRLTEERQILTDQLEQYSKTLDLLQTDDTPPEQSANPAIRSLAVEAAALKERLIAIAEQEVTLLQRQIIAARDAGETGSTIAAPSSEDDEEKPANAMESKPLRSHSVANSREQEVENVKRLHALLENYYQELQESARILPTPEEIAEREMAQRDAESLERIPFSVDKVRLSGSEGSTALAEITRRLTDPRIPESRRDIAPICLIKTRLFDTLIISENRSLKPVGKNHYIARVRIQPGDTTITIMSDRWELQLPQHVNARDFLITLYQPVDGKPELHVFAVDDLLAAENAHVPAWLPDELELTPRSG